MKECSTCGECTPGAVMLRGAWYCSGPCAEDASLVIADELAAQEDLHAEHFGAVDPEDARSIANALHVLWGSYSVLHALEGNRREAEVLRVYTGALDEASHGELTRDHIGAVSRLVKRAEYVPQWVRMLRLLLERQMAAKRPMERHLTRREDEPPPGLTAREIEAWRTLCTCSLPERVDPDPTDPNRPETWGR